MHHWKLFGGAADRASLDYTIATAMPHAVFK